MLIRVIKKNSFPRVIFRFNSSSANTGTEGKSGNKQGQSLSNPPGLSQAVIRPATDSVGPCVDPKKTGVYKVPEYFCYHNMSYFEAEIEMAKYRLPQPSALKK